MVVSNSRITFVKTGILDAHEKDKPIDLQRFHTSKLSKWTIIKLFVFLGMLCVLLWLLYFLFQKIQQTSTESVIKSPQEIQRLQIDTTGFKGL
jgi:type VI protein secretion system component VasF